MTFNPCLEQFRRAIPCRLWRTSTEVFAIEVRGLKQAELANSVGMSQNYLSQIETGKINVAHARER
ncbi:helix-turn-helix transcriptional regulator [Myxococcota bacterium]|nr:helix-turn-helix transcriptional regulator [Myxococcota bacterium]HHW95630.1 helix-turn-helix transcriptional regulator [Oligoflexales bacterium]